MCVDSHVAGKAPQPGLVCPACFRGKFQQPDAARVKLDILIVADTSPSIAGSRRQIAEGIKSFIDQLPPHTDYRFAVMAAHSDETYDPAKASTREGGKFVGGRVLGKQNESIGTISARLSEMLTRMSSDPASDGGELGLYALDKALSEPYLARHKQNGFFRDDAALAVIFVSDENDLCSAVSQAPHDNRDMFKGKSVEQTAHEHYCQRTGLTHQTVLEKLRKVKTVAGTQTMRPLIVSGIVYTDNATIPAMPAGEPFPQYYHEKELGRGYLDLIRTSDPQAVVVDLAEATKTKQKFTDGLVAIGREAKRQIEVKSEFVLRDGKVIDRNTLCVVVDNSELREVPSFETPVEGLSFMFNEQSRQLNVRGIGPTNSRGTPSQVDVFYCEPRELIEFNPEQFPSDDYPTKGEHYRGLPVPNACRSVRQKISSGQLD